MEENKSLDTLRQMFKNKDWFYDVGTDPYGRSVVYIKYMCYENLNDIPYSVGNKHVLTHFASNKVATREQFLDDQTKFSLSKMKPQTIDNIEELSSDNLEYDVEDLNLELDRLEKICGVNVLQSIFFESHDKNNAVTNLSLKYPEVRSSMDSLYNEYGFDVIYDYLEEL